MTSKDSNPKDMVGVRKLPFSVLPTPVLAEVALALLEGALKYRRHNYRVAGVRASVYYDATLRHLMAWWEGEDTDPDSGLNHITKAISSLMVLRDAMMQGKLSIDDRPPKAIGGWVARLNLKVAYLIDRTPKPVPPPHTAQDGPKPRKKRQ